MFKLNVNLSEEEDVQLYSQVCDALCRALWAEEYGIEDNDRRLHTSSEARRVATAVFEAIGL